MTGHTPWSEIKHKALEDRPLEPFFDRIMREHEQAMAERLEQDNADRALIAKVLANRDRVGPDAVVRKTKLPGGNEL